MARLEEQVAIVTGGSRGIGQAISERLAGDGAAVVIGYYLGEGPTQAEEVVSTITGAGGRAISVPTDVSKLDGVARLFETAKAGFGGIDILVNNAGGGAFGLL